MIESKFIELFASLPEIDGFTPFYEFGTEKDKNLFLESKRKEGVPFYPLIWLVTPVTTVGKARKTTTITLLIATLNQNITMSNRMRHELVFEPIIIPTKENVLKAMRRSGFINMTSTDIKETAYYNYGNGDEHDSTDIWDVLKLEVDIEFTEC